MKSSLHCNAWKVSIAWVLTQRDGRIDMEVEIGMYIDTII